MESRERVKSALINSGFDYPRGRITVNLTPASLRKNNSGLDLPTAAGILMCSGELSPGAGSRWGVIGELALDGLRCMNCVAHAKKALDAIPGVAADVTLDPQRALVRMDRDVPEAALRAAIESEGYRVVSVARR